MLRPLTGWLRKLFGDRGERLAARHLKQLGYRILARQCRNRLGEIDLIAMDQETVVFVEVKTRSSHVAGHPKEAVTYRKQQQLTRAALAWLKTHRLLERRARFDVVAITWQGNEPPQLEHVINAFEPVGQGQMYS
ncbi:YraN family protein [Planctomicrobium sp. SH664]|uniref:YraN family protein n=1 Tax=Planctomicrobium sp. SH664 TaxID=3448125 RepID=UPI003F5C2D1C